MTSDFEHYKGAKLKWYINFENFEHLKQMNIKEGGKEKKERGKQTIKIL